LLLEIPLLARYSFTESARALDRAWLVGNLALTAGFLMGSESVYPSTMIWCAPLSSDRCELSSFLASDLSVTEPGANRLSPAIRMRVPLCGDFSVRGRGSLPGPGW